MNTTRTTTATARPRLEILRHTLRRERRGLLWWTLGLTAAVLSTLAFYPSIRDSPELNDVVANLPESVKALIGGDDLLSAAGYLNTRLFGLLLPALFLIYAVSLGAGAIAGEEERGTLDLLLSLPLSRRALLLQKSGALLLLTAALGVALWLMLWLGARLVSMAISAGALAAAVFSLVLLALVFGALALAIGAANGRRGRAVGLAAAVAVASFLISSLAPLNARLKPLRLLSPFSYTTGANPLRNGLNGGHLAVSVALIAALVTAATLAFDRHDIGV